MGITGTNGKTTSAFLIAHLLDRAGLRAGLMGTVERRIGGKTLPAGRTTPEAVDVQRDFAEMVEAGDKAVVMEVSSHALDLGRVLGTRYRAVAFTNLTPGPPGLSQDHRGLLRGQVPAVPRSPVQGRDPQYAVINVDDPFGRELAAKYPRERLLGFSTTGAAGDWGPADLEWSDYEIRPGGTRGTMVLRGTALAVGQGGIGRPAVRTPPGQARRASKWPRPWWVDSTWPTL